mgnify:CR=1 FL=1
MKIKLNVKHYINYIFGIMKIVNGLNNRASEANKLKEKKISNDLSIAIDNQDVLPRSHAPSPPPISVLRQILMCYNEELKFDTKVKSSTKDTKIE